MNLRRGSVPGVISFVSLSFWIGSAILARKARRTRWLSQFPEAPNEECPSLCVIVPALNEESTIEPAMRSLLALDYPDLSIVAVDDRSGDRTGEILDGLAALDCRLSVIHIRELPSGWLGKNHALWRGSQQATGELLLFTDADVLFRPDALRRAASLVRSLGADHLTVAPGVIMRGFWEKLLVSYFVLLFAIHFRTWEVEDPESKSFVGIGAFNLVRREAYREVGGHSALPMDIADDMKLGKVLKRARKKQVCVFGGEWVRVRWVIGLRGFVGGLTKNMFAGLDYSWTKLAGVSVMLSLMHAAPLVLLFRGSRWTRVSALLGMLAAMDAASPPRVPSSSAADSGSGESSLPGSLYGLAYPLACVIYVYTMWRSAVLASWNGGIEWRGTRYSLDELKKNLV